MNLNLTNTHSSAVQDEAMSTALLLRRGTQNEALLHEISTFCRAAGMAESTFGRRAVNDG